MFQATLRVAAISCLSLAAMSAGAQQAAPAQLDAQHTLEAANKKIALEFFRKGITPEERLALLHPDYIQHNPIFKRFNEVNGVQGKEAFAAMMKAMRAGPPRPPMASAVMTVLAEGDFVTVLQKRELPDPQNPGKTYEGFWFDTWRVKDGKLYEHWDAATIPEKVPPFLQQPQPK